MPHDPDALEQSVANLLPDLRAYIRLKCGPRLREQESCSDLVQSALREVLRELGDEATSADHDPGLRARAFQAAERKIIDRARHWARDKRDWRRREALDEGQELARSYACLTSPSQALLGREAVEQLEAAFDEIPERYREAILLHRSAGLSYEEIGEALGMSAHSARTYVSRALARLASVYGKTSKPSADQDEHSGS